MERSSAGLARMSRQAKELWLSALSLAVICATVIMLTQMGPHPSDQAFRPSPPAWPPNALAHATG
jgi:hypothetical protein